MKLSPAQATAYEALRTDPTKTLTSSSTPKVRRTTVEALARRGLAEVVLERVNRTRESSRTGRITTSATITWTAELVPPCPGGEEMQELDLIIRNGERILRGSQLRQAAAYIAHNAPHAALEGSRARSPKYSVCRAYAEALEWPVDTLLDQVMMLRHMTGQTLLDGGIPAQDTGGRTDVWKLTAKDTGARPGKELGRVRAATQNAAALRGNSLLNTRGGYQMRRLNADEVDGWVEDFRARGLVLRVESCADGFLVSQVADERTLVIRRTAEEAKRDALADLSTLYALGSGLPAEAIHAD